MFSKFEIKFSISAKEILEKIEHNPVIQSIPIQGPFGKSEVRLEREAKDNHIRIRITRMLIVFSFFFGRAELISVNEKECKLRGWIVAGPILLFFFTFAYSFMTYELVRIGIRDFGTDRFVFSMVITAVAFLFFILIPVFVLRGWRKKLQKEITKKLEN